MPNDLTHPRGGVTAGGVDMNAVQAKQMALIDQMILWQLGNPGQPWSKAAPVLGFTSNWLRMVASSDAYRTRYMDVADQAMDKIGLHGIKERLNVALEVGLERMAMKIETSESLGDITDATEVLLKAHYGDGGQKGPQASTVSVNLQQIILEGKAQLESGHREPLTLEGTSEKSATD